SGQHARGMLASTWWLWPIAFPVGYLVLSTRLQRKLGAGLRYTAERAVCVFLPALVLLAVPLFWRALRLQIALIAVAAGLLVGAVVVAWRRPSLLPRPGKGLLVAWLVGLFGAIVGLTVLAGNPALVPGVYVGPFDGDI